jgi:hypothetical protein
MQARAPIDAYNQLVDPANRVDVKWAVHYGFANALRQRRRSFDCPPVVTILIHWARNRGFACFLAQLLEAHVPFDFDVTEWLVAAATGTSSSATSEHACEALRCHVPPVYLRPWIRSIVSVYWEREGRVGDEMWSLQLNLRRYLGIHIPYLIKQLGKSTPPKQVCILRILGGEDHVSPPPHGLTPYLGAIVYPYLEHWHTRPCVMCILSKLPHQPFLGHIVDIVEQSLEHQDWETLIPGLEILRRHRDYLDQVIEGLQETTQSSWTPDHIKKMCLSVIS